MNVSPRDYVHAGMRLGLGQTRSLELFREMGGQMRDTEWADLWQREAEAFRAWRSQSIK